MLAIIDIKFGKFYGSSRYTILTFVSASLLIELVEMRSPYNYVYVYVYLVYEAPGSTC